MADIIKSVTIKYSQTGMAEMTRQVENYTSKTRVMTSQMQNADGVWTTNKVTTTNLATAQNKLGATLNSTMMRFIGLNAVISMGSQAYQELRKFIDESVGAFRSFEYKMAEVSSILDAQTRNTLPSLEVGITRLSVEYGKSVEDMTKGLYDIVSAAFSVKDAIGLLEVATRAAIAGITTTTSAVNTLTGVLNAYGMSAANATQISDKLFQSVIRGVYTFSDLEGALGYVTPIAAGLGVALDEVLSAMSAATRQGQHLDSVTRGLGLLLQGIVDPTTQAADAAKKYGIDMSATALRTYGLTGFLKQLSTATEKYGMQILPQLIGNMRSLRVAIALTGDTGLKGFTDDMELMATTTGRTDAALTEMMNTQKMMVDILEQSMQKIERSIGEAWTGVDIAWKKIQLWWGTLVSGGDADKAVRGFDAAVSKIRKAYLQNIISPAKTGEKTVFDKLTSGMSVKQAIPVDVLNKYSENTKTIEIYNTMANSANTAKIALLELRHENEDLNQTLSPEILNQANVALSSLGIETVKHGISLSKYNGIMGEVENKIKEATGVLEILTEAQAGLRPQVDQVTAAFESMSSQIDETVLSIVMIKSEIAELNEQLNVPYKGFDSILDYGVAVKVATNQIERFAEYSQMVTSRGPEYLNEFTNQFDQYGHSMNDVLTTIYEYNDAMVEQKKVTEEAEKANKALEIQMAFNNIQMLKYQLIGMIRRRGNTRSEQRAMKQLEIENTKLRIQEMQNQYNASVANNDATNSEQEAAYNEAQEILSNYVEFEQHQLWLIQDTRELDLADLRQNIIDQTTELANKEKAYTDSFARLREQQELYRTAILGMAIDPVLAKAYEDLFGITAMAALMKAYAAQIAAISGISGTPPPISPSQSNIPGLPQTPAQQFANQLIAMGGGVSPSTGIVTPSPVISPKIPVGATGTTTAQLLNQLSRLRGYASGIDYVPSTGLAMVHRGERITPAGQNSGGGISIGNISITIPVKTNASPNDIAKAVTMALDAQILKYDSTGRLVSKYRRR